ncbi:MAG TPA: hypothetical protein VGA73_18125 [Candidatus Binatia bacterium]
MIKTLAEEIAELERECRRLEEWRRKNRGERRKGTDDSQPEVTRAEG